MAQSPEQPPIRIGGILILSGLGSQYGTHALQGATLALESIERGGGVHGRKIEVKWEDETGGRSERAIAAYRRLVSVHGVKFIFGPTFQDGLLAISPLIRKDQVFVVTPSSPRLGLPGVFSTWTDPDGEAADIAKFVRGKHSKVAILSGQQSWEQLAADKFQEAFSALGGAITNREEPMISTSDVRNEVLRTKTANPDGVFISSFTLFNLYAKELRRQRIQVPIFTIEADNSLLENSDGAAEGAISIGPSAPESDFTRRYRERFKVDPDIPSYQSFDAMMLLADALRSTDGTPAGVERFFQNLREYKGAAGTIASVNGKISVTTSFFVAENRKFRPISNR